MKKTNSFFVLISILLISLNCKSQNNILNFNEITINNFEILYKDANYLIQNFGQPNSIQPYIYEMDDENGEVYNYSGNLFYIMNNKIVSFKFGITNCS